MTTESEALRRQLRNAGITARAIDAVWPEWWSSEAESSLSAITELKYTVARRLGLSPRSLLEGTPKFVWRDEAKFKNLGAQSEQELAILSSFAVAVGRCAIEARGEAGELPQELSATALRSSILRSSQFVGLRDLLAFLWAMSIPVMQLRLFPLPQKRMHATTVRIRDRYAVLLGHESRFPSQVAFFLAHEIGHIALHHTSDTSAFVDIEDPLSSQSQDEDEEEQAANRFALELLMGDPEPDIVANRPKFNAAELAAAAMAASEERRIEPGMLALGLGHATGRWRQAFGALKLIPPGETDVGSGINELAHSQFEWLLLSIDTRDFLAKAMGQAHGYA